MRPQSYLTLCDPGDCNPTGSSVHGAFQARILEWAATSSSRGSSQPKDWARISCVFCIAGGLFTRWAARAAICQEEGTKTLSASCGSLLYVSESCCVSGSAAAILWPWGTGQQNHEANLLRALTSLTSWITTQQAFIFKLILSDSCYFWKKTFPIRWGAEGYKVVQIKGLRVKNAWTYFRV